jgi:beta-N-acetylhexosaminidase
LAVAAAGLAALSLLSGCTGGAPASSADSTDSTVSTDSTAGASTASASTLTPTSTPTASRQPSPTISPTCSTGAVLSTWTLARLAEQIVIVPVQEDSVASVTAQVAAGVGGVILFGSSAPPNIALSLARLARSAPDGLAPLVMVDEEGGSVQRMANMVGSIPSARQMGATMTASQIARIAADLGRRLRALGVTVDLAPVLDADGRPGPNDENPIGSRSFSADPLVARADGLAFAEGLQSSGVLAVVKHFPGLGGASGNSDLGPSVTLPWATVRESGLLPFAAAAAFPVAAVMVANASVPGLTKLPASISAAAITGVLRDQLGFRGLVVTDSMSAVALSGLGYSVPMASVAAVRAGADMVLFNASAATMAGLARGTVLALVSSVERGTLARVRLIDAVNHILAAKHVDLCAVR